MRGLTVDFRVDCHGTQAQFTGSAHDAYSDFTTIGNEEFVHRGLTLTTNTTTFR